MIWKAKSTTNALPFNFNGTNRSVSATNTSHRVIDLGVIPSLLSDHCLIFCVKSGIPKAPGRTIEFRSYRHCSKQEFLNDLREIDWDQALNKDDSAVGVWNKLLFTLPIVMPDKKIKN